MNNIFCLVTVYSKNRVYKGWIYNFEYTRYYLDYPTNGYSEAKVYEDIYEEYGLEKIPASETYGLNQEKIIELLNGDNPPENSESITVKISFEVENGVVTNGNDILLEKSSKPSKTDAKAIVTTILQKELNHILGLDMSVDGWYGGGTKQVVKEFQERYNIAEKFNLSEDGVLDRQTLYLLNLVLQSNSLPDTYVINRRTDNVRQKTLTVDSQKNYLADPQAIIDFLKTNFNYTLDPGDIDSYIRSLALPDLTKPQYPNQIKFDKGQLKGVQTALRELGFIVSNINGSFDVATSSSIILFQYLAGITITGRIGQEMLDTLKLYTNGERFLNWDKIEEWKVTKPKYNPQGTNGYIDTRNFVPIPEASGGQAFLPKETAVAWSMLVYGAANDTKTEYKVNINKLMASGKNSGYRTYNKQYLYHIQKYVDVRDHGYDGVMYKGQKLIDKVSALAAKPGSSPHGWGDAIDFALGQSDGTYQNQWTQTGLWLEANAKNYGFKGYYDNVIGGVQYYKEVWHWIYEG